MTVLRQSAITELEKIPEDKLSFVIQIMQGVNGLYNDNEREPFFEDAKQIILLCTDGKIKGCIVAHSISNMFFILRKDYTSKERRDILLSLCTIFDVEGIDKVKLLSGLENEEFSDFEDCLQMECAKSFGAEYIVTRNASDYAESVIKAILPNEYLKLKQ